MADLTPEMRELLEDDASPEELAQLQAADDKAVAVLVKLASRLPKSEITSPPETALQDFKDTMEAEFSAILEAASRKQTPAELLEKLSMSSEEGNDPMAEDSTGNSHNYDQNEEDFEASVRKFHETADEIDTWIHDGAFANRRVAEVTKQYRKLNAQLAAMRLVWQDWRDQMQADVDAKPDL